MSKTHKALIALVIANTIWGAASPIFKWSLENIQPFTLAFLRFSIAALILLPFAWQSLKIEKKDMLKVVMMAFFGVTINISFFFLGLKQTASINAPLIASSAPIFIILFSMAFLKEHPKKREVLGSLLGLLGVLLIIIEPLLSNGVDLSLIGNVFLITATFGSIIHILIAKETINKYNPIVLTFYSFAIGSLGFIAPLTSEINEHGFLSGINTQGAIGIVFGALLSSALAYYLFYWSMKFLPAYEVGLFTYLDPVIAILIAIPLLGEIPTATYIIGAILVFSGIYIAEGRIHYHPLHLFKKQPLP